MERFVLNRGLERKFLVERKGQEIAFMLEMKRFLLFAFVSIKINA